jgi:gluconokinase
VVAGTTAATTPVDTVRAWLEAVALRLAEALAAVEAGAGPVRRIAADGGALRASPAWCGMIADALGRTLHVAHGTDAAARGAALGALEHLGAIADLAEAPAPPSEAVEPDPAAGPRYAAEAERMRALEARLRGPAPHETT